MRVRVRARVRVYGWLRVRVSVCLCLCLCLCLQRHGVCETRWLCTKLCSLPYCMPVATATSLPDRQSRYTSKFRRGTATAPCARQRFSSVPSPLVFLVATSASFFARRSLPATVSALSAFAPQRPYTSKARGWIFAFSACSTVGSSKGPCMSLSVRRCVPVVNGDVTTTGWYVGYPPTSGLAAASAVTLFSGSCSLIDELFRVHPCLRNSSGVLPTNLGCGGGRDSVQPSRVRGRELRTPAIPSRRVFLVFSR